MRTDKSTGEETQVPIKRAYEIIAENYIDQQPVREMLHDGYPIDTAFATYDLRDINTI